MAGTYRCRFLKIVGFLCLVLICFHWFFRVFGWKDATGGDRGEDTVKHFYEMEDDIADVIFYGSSHCYCTVNQAVLWENTGIAGFNFATGCSNLGNTYYYMKESLKTQHPQLMAVEVFGVSGIKFGNAGNVYRNVLSLDWSREYLENAFYTKGISDVPAASSAELILKAPVIHMRYQDLSRCDFVDERPWGRGAYNNWNVLENAETPEACHVDAVGELSEETLYWLDKMVELADNEEIKLVFWVAPYLLTEEEAKAFNAVEEYSRTKDIEFINFNRIYGQIGFDYASDMADRGHLNVNGSNKVTDYLGAYLQEEYHLPSHRGEEAYNLWDLNAEAWEHRVSNYGLREIQDLQEFLSAIPSKGYFVAVMASGETLERLRGEYGEYQIDPENAYGGVCLWTDGKLQELEQGWLSSDLNSYTAVTVRNGVVNLAGEKFTVPQEGVKVVVFDCLLDEQVDSVYCSDLEQLIIER